mgnify:CR=1 FL=1
MKLQKSILSNHEFEYEIPIKDAEEIWALSNSRVTKRRYRLSISGGAWIVDCFEKENYPLVLAEVELPSEALTIEMPEWCTHEITGQKQWSNASLAAKPISKYSIAERLKKNMAQKEP